MEYCFVVDTCGDRRCEYAAAALKNRGYSVYEYEAFSLEEPSILSRWAYIFPPSRVLSVADAERILPNASVFAFTQGEEIREIFENRGIKHINIYFEEKFAYRNALITAEGALTIVASNTETALSETDVLVVGFGRVGKAVVKIFRPAVSGVDVLTFDRNECACAQLFSDRQFNGFEDIRFDAYDAVINTVPARLFGKNIISKLKDGVFLLELASDPGGFDKDAVGACGISFVLGAGLPAKTAPRSAARALVEEIIACLRKE